MDHICVFDVCFSANSNSNKTFIALKSPHVADSEAQQPFGICEFLILYY